MEKRYEVSMTTPGVNGGSASYPDCNMRETPEFLEISRVQDGRIVRFIHPWHSISRAVITELPNRPYQP